ncbi:hypothetical protein ACTFQF_00180 [Aliivibrio fischeri]|uniref:hypothetical protein n=1 Tax=Aliivibrio fischeri TaxID=668 RepID=UPI0007C4410B|nr:hypothetical protein [Aliivibrio fischeri]
MFTSLSRALKAHFINTFYDAPMCGVVAINESIARFKAVIDDQVISDDMYYEHEVNVCRFGFEKEAIEELELIKSDLINHKECIKKGGVSDLQLILLPGVSLDFEVPF